MVIFIGFNRNRIAFEFGDKTQKPFCRNGRGTRFGDFRFDFSRNSQFQIGGSERKLAIISGFDKNIRQHRQSGSVADDVADLLKRLQKNLFFHADFHGCAFLLFCFNNPCQAFSSSLYFSL